MGAREMAFKFLFTAFGAFAEAFALKNGGLFPNFVFWGSAPQQNLSFLVMKCSESIPHRGDTHGARVQTGGVCLCVCVHDILLPLLSPQ